MFLLLVLKTSARVGPEFTIYPCRTIFLFCNLPGRTAYSTPFGQIQPPPPPHNIIIDLYGRFVQPIYVKGTLPLRNRRQCPFSENLSTYLFWLSDVTCTSWVSATLTKHHGSMSILLTTKNSMHIAIRMSLQTNRQC